MESIPCGKKWLFPIQFTPHWRHGKGADGLAFWRFSCRVFRITRHGLGLSINLLKARGLHYVESSALRRVYDFDASRHFISDKNPIRSMLRCSVTKCTHPSIYNLRRAIEYHNVLMQGAASGATWPSFLL
ncbi:MAG: hypothetical protein HQL51_08665 [Magnetococcales bacterium]|nr:hypothetical protein [Magnetococcales bacterium]